MNAKPDNAVIALVPIAIARAVTTVLAIAISAGRDTVTTAIVAMITAVKIAITAKEETSLS